MSNETKPLLPPPLVAADSFLTAAFACLSVCEQDSSKSDGWIILKYGECGYCEYITSSH